MELQVYSSTLIWDTKSRSDIKDKMISQGWKIAKRKRVGFKIVVTFSIIK